MSEDLVDYILIPATAVLINLVLFTGVIIWVRRNRQNYK